jgi:hypothetical protein
MKLKGVGKHHIASLLAACALVLTVVDTAFFLPAISAPIEGNESMAELTPDDRKPLQLSSRQDINHEGREAFRNLSIHLRQFQKKFSDYVISICPRRAAGPPLEGVEAV